MGACTLKEVIAILRPERWAETKRRLEGFSLPDFTQHRVLGRGRERGLRYLPRQGATARTMIRCLPQRMVSWTVEQEMVEPLIQALLEANCTRRSGDGRIFVLPVAASVSIHAQDQEVPETLPVLEPVLEMVPSAREAAFASRQ